MDRDSESFALILHSSTFSVSPLVSEVHQKNRKCFGRITGSCHGSLWTRTIDRYLVILSGILTIPYPFGLGTEASGTVLSLDGTQKGLYLSSLPFFCSWRHGGRRGKIIVLNTSLGVREIKRMHNWMLGPRGGHSGVHSLDPALLLSGGNKATPTGSCPPLFG